MSLTEMKPVSLFYVYLELMGGGFNKPFLNQRFLQEYLRYCDAKIHR